MTTTAIEPDTDHTNQLALPTDAQDLLFRTARTANSFADEPVSDEQIRAIYDLVKYAPTAANSQPLRITFLRSQQAKDRLLPLMHQGNRAKNSQRPHRRDPRRRHQLPPTHAERLPTQRTR